jgi:soluble lytic murein transglycosylase
MSFKAPIEKPLCSVLLLIIVSLFSVLSYATGQGVYGARNPEGGRTSEELKRAAGFMDAGLLCHAEKILLNIAGSDSTQKGPAFFLLGRLYEQKGFYDKAVDYLLKAAEEYPLLRDYALTSLIDVYMASGNYEDLITSAGLIRNDLLQQYAKQAEIASLLVLEKDDEARRSFAQYAEQYPRDREYRMTFAALLNSRGELEEAIQIYKEIYMDVGQFSEHAFHELKVLEADTLTVEERLQRADTLFERYAYSRAESEYEAVLPLLDDAQREKVMFAIGMSQFRMKRYRQSARTFTHYQTPKWMYWQARSLYRINDMEGFKRVRTEYEKKYPRDERLALLLMMEAEEMRRRRSLSDAEKSYKAVLSRFPDSSEEALWGLAWMHYSSGKYKEALRYFSELTSLTGSRDYYKYMYWKARSQERTDAACPAPAEKTMDGRNEDVCNGAHSNVFSELPSDESYYGYLIRLRNRLPGNGERIEISKPVMPDGETYERIEMLLMMGLKNEASREIADSLRKAKSSEELLYLSYMAMKTEQYRQAIYYSEAADDEELLPYSYPRAYWDTITHAADSEDLDEYLVAALIREESRYDPDAVSWAGAVGLMQLMPSTARRMNRGLLVHIRDSSELVDARTNIYLGTHYLAGLVKEFNELPFAIAAYNAGENALRRWLTEYEKSDITEFIENIPYRETRRYVKKVLKSYWQYRSIDGLPLTGIRDQGSGPRVAQLTPDR